MQFAEIQSLVMGQFSVRMFRRESAFFRRKLASSDDVNSFSAGVLSQGSHSDQLVSSLVGLLPSEQEKSSLEICFDRERLDCI